VRKLAHSYLFLRRFIGILGVALPVVVALGVLAMSGSLLTSISASYHTGMRNWFVGSLCAIGVFLIFYRGSGLTDDILSWIGGLAAIGVALVPTRPAENPTQADFTVGYVHIGLSAGFFLALAVFCFRFTGIDPGAQPDPEKKKFRNKIYVSCGVVILVCLLLIGLFGWVLRDWAAPAHPVLWLEALAILAFGWSWFIKGRTLWRGNEPPLPSCPTEAEVVGV
jgi:hypothetical protein